MRHHTFGQSHSWVADLESSWSALRSDIGRAREAIVSPMPVDVSLLALSQAGQRRA